KIGAKFREHNIEMHFDVGPNYYQNSDFIVPAGGPGSPFAKGGDVIEEQEIRCGAPNLPATTCDYGVPYSVVNWKAGFIELKNGDTLSNGYVIPRHFNHNRKDIAHYALLGHAVAGPFSTTQPGVPCLADGVTCQPGVPPTSRSGFSDGWGGDFFVTLGLWRFD